MKQLTTMVAALLLSPLVAASLPVISASEPESMTRKLKLEVVRTLPEPVIGKDTPGAEAIRGGFEGGTTVKVKIGDKTQYHLFSSGMENLDWSKFHLEHWISDDGNRFQRKDVCLERLKHRDAGWQILGSPPAETVWRFTSFDPLSEKDKRDRKDVVRNRPVTLPKKLAGWFKPDYDDSDWKSGKAPIGRGLWQGAKKGDPKGWPNAPEIGVIDCRIEGLRKSDLQIEE
jgi:hypothetical protein